VDRQRHGGREVDDSVVDRRPSPGGLCALRSERTVDLPGEPAIAEP
jgi:hypothetical protein